MSGRPSVGFVGAGKLSGVLLPAVRAAGYDVGAVCAARIASARALRRGMRGVRAVPHAEDVARASKLVLLAVPDARIQEVAARLADAEIDWSGRIVLHHSGILGADALAPLRGSGAALGVLHPLQCLAQPALAARVLAGSHVRIEGDARAERVARRLARDLGLLPLPRASGAVDRAAYHAAASLASNDLVALLSEAVETMTAAGYERRAALSAILTLARGTLTHAEEGGLEGALTGPVVRGDASTLAEQLARLRAESPRRARLHRALSGVLLELAERSGVRLEPARRKRIRRLLGSAGRREKPGV
ncbi:MAG: DUF2520 domain-containing protein [bacterium]|nr:DUF2520 domain-containing protein [bacterium]